MSSLRGPRPGQPREHGGRRRDDVERRVSSPRPVHARLRAGLALTKASHGRAYSLGQMLTYRYDVTTREASARRAQRRRLEDSRRGVPTTRSPGRLRVSESCTLPCAHAAASPPTARSPTPLRTAASSQARPRPDGHGDRPGGGRRRAHQDGRQPAPCSPDRHLHRHATTTAARRRPRRLDRCRTASSSSGQPVGGHLCRGDGPVDRRLAGGRRGEHPHAAGHGTVRPPSSTPHRQPSRRARPHPANDSASAAVSRSAHATCVTKTVDNATPTVATP